VCVLADDYAIISCVKEFTAVIADNSSCDLNHVTLVSTQCHVQNHPTMKWLNTNFHFYGSWFTATCWLIAFRFINSVNLVHCSLHVYIFSCQFSWYHLLYKLCSEYLGRHDKRLVCCLVTSVQGFISHLHCTYTQMITIDKFKYKRADSKVLSEPQEWKHLWKWTD
jgi:hypothetical protein